MLKTETKAKTMRDLLKIRPQHLRSVQIERDYADPSASAYYVVTPFVAATFERIGQGLQFCSTARAWRLTGDYGSGKSSFMLAFARHAARAGAVLPVDLRTADPAVRLEPVLVVGEREPVAESLVRALRQTIGRLDHVPPRALAKQLSAEHPLGPSAVLDLVSAVGDWVRTQQIASGLLIVFDELGKNLEFAAGAPGDGDLQLLQNLAEAAARSGVAPLVVVAVLHQAVTAYARDLPSTDRREWEKVSGRFEEIVFAPPLEQSAALVAAALGLDESQLPKALGCRAKAQLQTAVAAGWYGPGANLDSLDAIAPALAPLDAFVLPVLSRLLRRFGQNERSLFSFLSSAEPGGLLAHAGQPLTNHEPYRLHDLYDYLSQNLSGTLAGGASSVRWNLVEGVVRSAAAKTPLERNVLKTVGLINLLDDPGFSLTPELLVQMLADETVRSQAEAAVRRLKDESRILYDRGAGGGLCLWPHTSVDLQAAFEQGLAAVSQNADLIAALRPVLPTEPLVARRHYVETGTMRHFDVSYVPVVALADALHASAPKAADGHLLIVLARNERERETALAMIAAYQAWPKTLVVGVPPTVGELAPLLRDFDAWTWVANETPALSGDRIAREEIARQIAMAEDRLRRALAGLIDFKGSGSVVTRWFYCGAPLDVRSGRQLTEALSDVCDAAFRKAPIVTNELLNRRQLSSAAARARTLLIEALAQAADKPLLGLDETHMPPEMAAYLSIVRAGNVHICRDERWQIVRPDPDPLNIAPALDRIGEVLRREEDRRVPYLEVAAALKGPDYGIRDGLIPLLVAIYLAAYWHHTAVYEEGTYLEKAGGPEFMRMLKEPEFFTLQHCAVEGVRTAVFKRLAEVVGVPNAADSPDLLDVVRPLMQFVARLPDHARRTRNLNVTAASVRNVLIRVQDPTAMLFRDLPRACGLEPFSADEELDEERLDAFVSAIAKSVHDLHAAYPALLDRIAESLGTAMECTGSLEVLQTTLARRAEPLVASVTDPELKSFALRLADQKLTPKLWLESIASFLARKPPERWAEPDEREFHNRLKLLSRRFMRVEIAHKDSLKTEGAAGEAVFRLVITAGDGRELEDLLRGQADDADVAALERELGALIDRHGRAGMLAMTRALLARAERDEPTSDV
ncbi:hypothetical protein SAZ10_19455 [Mesorhizobium sp. BAC0120]|uniref:hypothetical protein n=1 Tax=Mesorhizobium sp. BAC0120 TaxID=3090670 RepID=UPI00298C588C|nr:hypothetical protein [Mesorhizobium sp. BAC0120]MDW6023927.1 hypothetical protein [Mesorhizobium sp. BAC0120]